MSRNSMISECNRNNEKNRNVVQSKYLSMKQFWQNASGSFLISGDAQGMEEERRRMLISALQHCEQLAWGNVVILHQDEELEEDLIRLVQEGTLPRKLVVISEKYRNYHVFYNMDKMDVINCIHKTGTYLRYSNMAGVDTYGQAFLEILNSMYTISLPAMMSMAELNDERIIELAVKQGVSEYWIQQLKGSSKADSDNFRLLIRQIYNAMEKITTGECETGFTISSSVGQNQILCIHMKSRDNAVMNICIGAELQELLGRQTKIILDNISLCSEDGLWDILNSFNKRDGNCLGICGADVSELWNQREWRGFETQVIFRHSYPQQMENYLRKFGSYRHAQVAETQTPGERKGFRLISQKSWHIEHYDRLRILPEEVEYAVLKGHRGDRLELVRYMTD